MENVKQILDRKGYDVFSVSPESTVFDALKVMSQNEVGALLVLKDQEVVGIFSERDYARKVVLLGKSSRELAVKNIMSTKVLYVKPQQQVEDCMALMINKRIRHLPVLENGKLIGMISIGDVVKAVIGEKEFIIDQLINYITGTAAVNK